MAGRYGEAGRLGNLQGALQRIRDSNGFACALAGANAVYGMRIKTDGTRISLGLL